MKKNFSGKNFLIVIPARGGSKGIKAKNIFPVNGIPLIQYTIEFAKTLELNSRIIISTDSNQIANLSKSLGAECPFLRPKYLSGDLVGDMPVLKHALKLSEMKYSELFNYVIMLQPTSPIRIKKQIYDAIKTILKNNYDSVLSVTQVDKKFHPYKQFELHNSKLKTFSQKSRGIIARQQLGRSYIRNGIVYVFSRNFVLKSNSVFSKNSGHVLINEPVVNIDTLNDLIEFEKFLNSNSKSNLH
jgi:CMP-N-acetylneuraminic acid synthetase